MEQLSIIHKSALLERIFHPTRFYYIENILFSLTSPAQIKFSIKMDLTPISQEQRRNMIGKF